MKVLTGHSNGIVGLAQDEKYLYSGSKDRSIRVWEKAGLTCVHVISGFPCGVKPAAGGDFLYAITAHGRKNKLFSVWRKRDFSKMTEFELPAKADLQGIVQDEKTVFVTSRDGKIFPIDKQTLELRDALQQNEAGIWGLALDHKYLYTGSVDQIITIWDKATCKPARVLKGHRANIQSIIVDEKYLYSIATDKTALVWEKQSGEIVWQYKKLFPKGMLGLAATESHLLFLNGTQGIKIVRKGLWDKGFLNIPVRTTEAVVDQDRCYFAVREGNILAYPRTRLGV